MTDQVRLRRVDNEAPWEWLAGGWSDLKRTTPLSLYVGAAFVVGAGLITALLWIAGLSSWIPVAAGGFALVGPVFAVGVYEMGRRLETDAPVDMSALTAPRLRSPSQIAMLAALLLFIYLVWMRIAIMLFALFVTGEYVPFTEFTRYVLTHPDGLQLAIVGTIVGGFLALVVFAVSALSIPVLMNRRVDIVTAVTLSVSALISQPRVMLLWAWIIAMILAASALTGFLGLIVAFPVLGFATWRSYRAMVEDVPEAERRPVTPTSELKEDDHPLPG